MNTQKTHFGFETVDVTEKAGRVAQVFSSVASKYDIMNDVMSFGVHRYWKQATIDLCKVRKGQKILDLAGGTGDLTAKFSRLVGENGEVVLADINPAMLEEGRKKLIDKGIVGNVRYEVADAEKLPFPDNYFDCITMAFGLRNVTDKAAALRSMHRVLKPGGRVMILEFSKPAYAWLNKIYDAYSFQLLPKFGRWIANDEASYRYLAESIRMHPDQETLLQMLNEAGFENTNYLNFSGGIVALHRGFKI